jgi:NAD(P)-dependent dehydrogenase (short-subunit alcohol dehydrogenase family)
MIDLTGRVALVTGAGRNVGAGIARTLAACGAVVAVNDLIAARAEASAAEVVAAGGQAVAVAADVTDPDAVAAMITRITSDAGPVDILVNNAGVPSEGAPAVRFRQMSTDDWDRFLRLNLYAVLVCTRAVLDGMCDRGWGRVITISSEAGRAGMPPGLSLYAAAKAGAVGFSRVLAREVGTNGVTVNCVSLGTIDNAPILREEVRRATPMRRFGTPADVGAAVAYLASEGAGWVTGQTLPVNGGFFTT